MEQVIFPAFVATLGTWLITALGAATVVFFKDRQQNKMDLLLGFAAGVMIAASFWSLLQPAIERAEASLQIPAFAVATVGFLCGAAFMWLADKTAHFALSRLRGGTPDVSRQRILLLVLAITLHNIPEGLAVGVAFGALHGDADARAWMGAISIAVGIGLQNFPEGAAVALPLRREGYSRTKSLLIGQASGMVEPVAGVIGALAVVAVQPILPFALSFAAGAMILVAVHELIPECQQNKQTRPYTATAGIVFGFAIMMMLDVALG